MASEVNGQDARPVFMIGIVVAKRIELHFNMHMLLISCCLVS